MYKPLNKDNIPNIIFDNLNTSLKDAEGIINPGRHKFIPVGQIMIVNCSDIKEPIEQVKVLYSNKKTKIYQLWGFT